MTLLVIGLQTVRYSARESSLVPEKNITLQHCCFLQRTLRLVGIENPWSLQILVCRKTTDNVTRFMRVCVHSAA